MPETLTELLAALTLLDSTNPALVTGGAGESAIAQFVVHWLTAHSIAAELDEAAPGRFSVIATVKGRGAVLPCS